MVLPSELHFDAYFIILTADLHLYAYFAFSDVSRIKLMFQNLHCYEFYLFIFFLYFLMSSVQT